ncbi:MAG TPA: SDR family oxidoreductase [Acidimicrobiales bacterium]|nr:SDR family oxidoreductase [Acidimicrobiales bacterium]
MITGAARGLGREYASYFADDGANVVATDLDAAGAEETAAAIRKDGGVAIGLGLDVTDWERAVAVVAAARDEFGSLDILVNNAGIWGDYSMQGALGQDLDNWRTALDVMLTGPFVCMKAAIPVMRERRWGRVVNISSIGAYLPGSGAYGVAKLGLNQLTYQVAAEVGADGITVNSVAPGTIDNEATRRQVPQAALDMLVQQTAVKRPGTGRDLYGAISWLCSDDAAWVTGQVISPNGGAVARF